MAEWLYEEGIGENRAILVEDDDARVATSPGRGYAARGAAYPRILAAAIELPDEIRCGSILAGRLVRIAIPGRRGIVATDRGEVMVEPLPPALTEGQAVRVEIVREPIAEPGNPKFARGRISDAAEREGPSLAQRIGAGTPLSPHGPDRFEESGWSELIDEAIEGVIDFAGGELRMSLTPAMTVFDVDGFLPPVELAMAGAEAAALAIRRLDIGGSIGIDLPTVPSREDRLRIVASLDAVLPRPFERTAVNGFGFLQVVRRRERRSLPELLQWDEVGGAARALLRRAERVPGVGARLLTASPAVIDRIEANPSWIARLGLVTGTAIRLQGDAGRPTWAGHVQSVQS